MKDFAGWTCEFKANGTYHHAAVTKTGIAMSGDGTYSLDGHTLRMGQPDIGGDSPNSPNQIIMFGMIKRFTPPESTITWTSDDEFTLTHRNELRGENESCTWVRQK